MTSRRKFIVGGTLTAALGAYSYHRGLRYPRLSFEPRPLATQFEHKAGIFELDQAIHLQQDSLSIRAIAPEPHIRFHAKRGRWILKVSNIAKSATLSVTGDGIKNIQEHIKGTTRSLTIDAAISQTVELKWSIGQQNKVSFAVIGDTGGNQELDWCLQRAVDLGATFLLHLGDFNYGKDDYQQAINKFHNAPLPCYVSIGNHDFHDSGLIYDQFREQIGPMNHYFEFGGLRFINIDTAADFFPASGGNRGELISQLISAPTQQQIFFTHRPLKDPRPGQDHEIGGVNEIPWLTQAIKDSGGGTLLTGHIHHSADLVFDGIRQLTAGEGLGYEDIILKRQTAQMLIGDIQDGQVTFRWEPLNMPWRAHQSHTHEIKLRKDGLGERLDWLAKVQSNEDKG